MTQTVRIGLAGVAALTFAVAALTVLTRADTAPRVEYTLLDGSRHSSDELRGKVVLVHFWATSCAPCRQEMPGLIETQRRFRARGLETLSVAMRYDPPAYVMQYAESHTLPFLVTMDNTGEIARRYGQVQLTPTTFVLDQRGRIVKQYVGAVDLAQLQTLLDQLLTV